ncbi:thermonuclease family protein [Polaromonas sp.]|uniref:thermonuclease family protein n=1 Tax=Polaromonas sp. TaxID=1869339 RepID=UPI003BAA737B
MTQERQSSISSWILSMTVVLFSFFAFSASAGTLLGKVIGVSDGDTLDVLYGGKTTHRIRLAGIDAPEKAQAFGQRSKEHLSDIAFSKQVEVVTGKTDKYGRTVGKVLVNGIDANLEQVRSGVAWHYKEYASEQSVADRALYITAEEKARTSRLGLWRDNNPMPPWEWRHGGKDEPTLVSIASGCPCSGESLCTGTKGGPYCVAPNGKRRYR